MVSGFRIDLLESNSGDSIQQLTPETDANSGAPYHVTSIERGSFRQFQTFQSFKASRQFKVQRFNVKRNTGTYGLREQREAYGREFTSEGGALTSENTVS